VVTSAMFVTLACTTCILLIVILIATSSSKPSAAGSQRKLHAGSAKGAGRPISRSESAETLRPRIRQGLDSKAVVKAALTDSRPQVDKAAKSKPLTDRKLQSIIFQATQGLNEAAEKTPGSARATPGIPAPAEAAALVSASSLVKALSDSRADGSAPQVCAATAQEAREVKNAAPLLLQEPIVAEVSAHAQFKQAEVAESAAISTGIDHSLNPGSLRRPVQDAPVTVEMLFPRLTRGNAANVTAVSAKGAAESDLSQGLLIGEPGEELRAPSLLAFYGLNQQPFDVTPDPAYLYRSRVHREAFEAISQGIENLRGFVALVAQPGMGKTTLLNKLMEELSASARVVFLFQTQCNSSELLRQLLTELGVEHDGTDVVAMHKVLNQALFEEMLQGRRFVLIVDEAQNLQDSVLETIRLLSNYETTHSKLIQIVLAGQPQLVETLMRPGLVQLRQRIAVVANLEPLDASETAEYIEHRLRAAGSNDMPIFTRDAMALIAERSQGIPRIINNICFNAMLAGYMNRQLMIDAEIVKRVASKLDLELLVRRPQQESVSAARACFQRVIAAGESTVIGPDCQESAGSSVRS